MKQHHPKFNKDVDLVQRVRGLFTNLTNSNSNIECVEDRGKAYDELKTLSVAMAELITRRIGSMENLDTTLPVLKDIRGERIRQFTLGYSSASDDKLTCNELPLLAVRYTYEVALGRIARNLQRKHLVQAAALLVAEIERLDRANERG